MKPSLKIAAIACLFILPSLAADKSDPGDITTDKPARKVEKPVNFIPAKPDPLMGDWQGQSGLVAQVFPAANGAYTANLLKAFDTENNGVAVLHGTRSGDTISFTGDGWTGVIQNGHFTGSKGTEAIDLQPIARVSPTNGAAAPPGAIVLFDGKNMDAWAKKSGKDWLAEDGPSRWKLVDGGAMEVVSGSDCIITHQKFGDCKVHLEFRTLGAPTNSGVFFEDRYECNINETYGRTDGNPNAGFDNCTDNAHPKIRPCYPPLAWQTFDIEFHAPRFDPSGKKIANAQATVLFNGVKIYDKQELDLPHGAAAKLGEEPTGPLMLQEHGMPIQFRNIWLVESKN
jgi:Domain of Unknown Function (DUF1080)